MTNKATLWYVPLSLKNVNKVVEVPPIQVGLWWPWMPWGQLGVPAVTVGVQCRVPLAAVHAQGAGG